MGLIPTEEGALVQAEGMMAILLAGGIQPQLAAWFGDLMALYVGAVAIEESIWTDRAKAGAGPQSEEEAVASFQQLFASLPDDRFPHLKSMAAVLVAGDGARRFEFALDVLIEGLKSLNAREA